jgi:hypothetical protein
MIVMNRLPPSQRWTREVDRAVHRKLLFTVAEKACRRGKNMSTIPLFIRIVHISHDEKGVCMFYDLNQDDNIYLQFMI